MVENPYTPHPARMPMVGYVRLAAPTSSAAACRIFRRAARALAGGRLRLWVSRARGASSRSRRRFLQVAPGRRGSISTGFATDWELPDGEEARALAATARPELAMKKLLAGRPSRKLFQFRAARVPQRRRARALHRP